MSLLEVSVSFPSLIMASAIAPFKCCYSSSMAPHGLRTQLGDSIRNRNITVYPLYCCCCSVAQLYLTLCNPMNCSTSGFPVLHYFPECAQLLCFESVMPSHHFILCCPLALNLSQHQWVGSPHQVAKVLELQLQHQSFQWIFRVDFL